MGQRVELEGKDELRVKEKKTREREKEKKIEREVEFLN